jgi:hypothetical protein
MLEILDQHANPRAWLEGTTYEGSPRRRRAQVLLTYPEILLLMILHEMASDKTLVFARQTDFMLELNRRIDQIPLDPRSKRCSLRRTCSQTCRVY